MGILGDPAKSPGSCSPKKGLVTHQALRPAAGEPILPIFQTRAAGSRVKLGSSQLHHTCPSCSRSSTRGHLACRPGSQRRRKLTRPETLGPPGPAESDGALGGLSQGTEQTRTLLQGSAACSSPANPSLPQRRRTFASSCVSCALIRFSRAVINTRQSGNAFCSPRSCFFKHSGLLCIAFLIKSCSLELLKANFLGPSSRKAGVVEPGLEMDRHRQGRRGAFCSGSRALRLNGAEARAWGRGSRVRGSARASELPWGVGGALTSTGLPWGSSALPL